MVCCRLVAVRCVWRVDWCVMANVCYVFVVIRRALFVVCCVLVAVSCVLLAWLMLFVASCLLSVA